MNKTQKKIDEKLGRTMEWHELTKKRLEWEGAILTAQVLEIEYNDMKDMLEAKEILEPMTHDGRNSEMKEFINNLPITKVQTDEELDAHLKKKNPPGFPGPLKELEKNVLDTLRNIRNAPENNWTEDLSTRCTTVTVPVSALHLRDAADAVDRDLNDRIDKHSQPSPIINSNDCITLPGEDKVTCKEALEYVNNL